MKIDTTLISIISIFSIHTLVDNLCGKLSTINKTFVLGICGSFHKTDFFLIVYNIVQITITFSKKHSSSFLTKLFFDRIIEFNGGRMHDVIDEVYKIL